MSSFTMLRFEVHNSLEVYKLDYLGENLNQKMCIQGALTANKLSVQCTGLDLLQNSPANTYTCGAGSHHQWFHSTGSPPSRCSSSTARLCAHVSSLWRSEPVYRMGYGIPVEVS